jgi:hypothetical protein
VACLVASCHAVGVNRATMGIVLLAYLAGMSVSSISLVPGGLGIVDAALIVMLVRGGVSAAAAASGVVLYRMVSLGFVVLAGWGALAGHWLAARRSVDRPTVAPTVDDPPVGPCGRHRSGESEPFRPAERLGVPGNCAVT